MEMEQALSALDGFDGWMIGTCRARLNLCGPGKAHGDETGRTGRYIAKLQRQSSSVAVIQVNHEEDGGSSLQVLLINPSCSTKEKTGPSRPDQSTEPDQSIKQPKKTVCFSGQQIDTFVKAVSDDNPIHRGQHAVVPGFLMMNELAACLLCGGDDRPDWDFVNADLDVKFRSPLRAGEMAGVEQQMRDDNSLHVLIRAEDLILLEMKLKAEYAIKYKPENAVK